MSNSQPAPTEVSGHVPAALRAYVNDRGVTVPRGATALDVVRAFDAGAADAVAAGSQRLTDSRGLPIDAATVAHGGAIYRLLPVRTAMPDPIEGDA